jgi:hypothetical protein
MFKKIKLIILFSSKALKRKYRINKFNKPDKRKPCIVKKENKIPQLNKNAPIGFHRSKS